MTNRDTEIVSALSRGIASRVGEDYYELWFAAGDALRFDGQTLVVSAGSPFKLDRIRSNFRDVILDVCREVLQEVPTLEFCIAQPTATSAGSDDKANSDNKANSTDEANSAGNTNGADHAGKADSAGRWPGKGNSTRSAKRPSLQDRQPASDRENSSQRRRRRFSNFRTFVACEGNRLALTSCEMVVDRPGQISPLYLYGPPGVGKTHLLESVWSAIRNRSQFKRVVYLSAEQFTSYFLSALKGTGLPSFRRKYRGADVLILDDVQFFAGKRATLTELQHTVDELLREGRQLIVAGHRPPGQMKGLGESLMARFASGMVCAIQPAQRDARLVIARQIASSRNFEASRDVLHYIADHLPGDARQIGGALYRLQAASTAFKRSVDLALAREVLADLVRSSRRSVKLDDIEKAVCECLGLDQAKLQSPQKTKAIAQPRMLAMYLARKHTPSGLSEIGHHFGRRSHTTVVSAQKRVDHWIAEQSTLSIDGQSWDVADAIRQIEGRLRIG